MLALSSLKSLRSKLSFIETGIQKPKSHLVVALTGTLEFLPYRTLKSLIKTLCLFFFVVVPFVFYPVNGSQGLLYASECPAIHLN